MGRTGEFEVLVLLAAMRLGPDEAYAVSIADEIAERTGRSTRRSNVYTALRRLEDKGMVSTRLGEPRAERGGKARRVVAVEDGGVEAVRAATLDLRAMIGGVEHLLDGAG